MSAGTVPSVGDRQAIIDAAFDAFWMMYPRKIAKAFARKSFNSAVKKAHYEEILLALRSQIDASAFSDDKGFIPYPASWLNAERWSDEIIPHRRTPFRNGAAELLAREWMEPTIEGSVTPPGMIEGPAHG